MSAKIYALEAFEDASLVEEILTARHGRKFSISVPKIGEKKRICEMALTNAQVFIQKYLKTHDDAFLDELKEYFGLACAPYAIETFDNSHMFGAAAVGAMVR